MKAAVRLLLILALVAPAFASAQTQTAPAPTCRLFTSAAVVNYNTKVRLDWKSSNATSGYLNEVGAIPPNGTAFVVPGKNTTYAASFTGPGGTIVCRVGIAVRAGGAGTGGTGGAIYSGGYVNVNGSINLRGSTIDTAVTFDANGNPISTTVSPIDTAPIGTGVDTSGNPISTGNPIDTAPIGTGIDVNGYPINTTGNPIDTAPIGTGIDTSGTLNFGGPITFPTAQSVAPSTVAPGGGGFVGGIVPQECRGSSTVKNCDLCSLAQMGQNLANFLLGLTIPAAALLFAWAGILFFSSRGVPEQINRAKKIFMTVVIGFVIAIAAWTLISTVMNVLIQGSDFESWNWKSLNCAQTRTARLYNMSLSQYLNSSLPALQSYSGGSGAVNAGGCPAGSTPEGARCIDYTGGRPIDVGPVSGGGGPSGGTSCPTGYSYTTDEGGYCQSSDPSTPDAWTEACPTGYVYTSAEGGYCENPNNPNDWKEVPVTGGGAGAGAAGGNYTSEQRILLDACSRGDMASCNNFSASSGSGDLGARIAAATQQYIGTDTSMGPDGGNKACAWAVNNILTSAGIAPLGGNSVESVERTLQSGRGTLVNTSAAVPGDIIVWKDYSGTASHVGICQNAGCTSAISNSSGNATFTTVSGSNFLGQAGRVYHLNN